MLPCSDPTTTIPTGVVSNSDSTEPTYLPGWEPSKPVWETPTGASPFGLAPVPALQPLPPVTYRPEVASVGVTRVGTDVNAPIVAGPSRADAVVDTQRSRIGARPRAPIAGPSRMIQARAPSTFAPRGVPGSARVNVDLVSPFTNL